MEKPSRGRARGRAYVPEQPGTGGQPGAQQTRPGGAWGSGNPMRGGPASQPPGPPLRGGVPSQPQAFVPPKPQGAWGQSQQQQQPPRQAAPPQETLGRSQYRGGGGDGPKRTTTEVAETAGVVAGGGNGGDCHSGRGAHRGRRAIPEMNVATRLAAGKQGTTGDICRLQTNYFRLVKRTDWCIFQYRVDFAPEIDETYTKKKLFYSAVKDTMDIKGLFDGTLMYTPFRISPDPKELVVDSLSGEEKVRISIRMVGEVGQGDYHYIQIYNLILRKCMGHLNLQLVGRDYYDPGNKVTVSKLNMELWPGVLSSIRQHEKDVLWCCEIKYKVMKNSTALDLINQCMHDVRGPGDWQSKFVDKILNCVIITEYNNKTYHIDDVDFESTPASSFELKDNSRQTFADYYKKRYGITINNMRQPLLISKAKERDLRAGAAEIIKLIPELCRLTGLTEQERANRGMMAEIADFMRPTPQQRVDNLVKFSQRIQAVPKSMEELKFWDLALSKDIITLNGRQLKQESLRFGGGEYNAGREVDWTKELRSKPMFREGDISSWAVVYPPREKHDVQAFYNHLNKAAAGMRWALPKAIIKEMRGFDQQSYNRALEEVCSEHPDIRLLFVVVPKGGDSYNFIKKKLTVEKGIPSQLITKHTLGHKSALSIATKVAIQMNCKVGGAPWTIKVPIDVMFCGFDVCHDPKNKSRSFGAFVASYDRNGTAYYSNSAAHKDGEELSNFIGFSMAKALNQFITANGRLPAKILFYRDGVGDGQLTFVYEHELKFILKTCQEIYKEQQLCFRMIVVNKRINTRFFANGRNPNPGTVVDDVVTMPDRSDFYLIPQCTRQGTVSPTYYNILGPDDFGLDADKTQIMTYRLCHQYYNWSGTVRVPAPCQYAHKLAFLTAQSLQRPPKENLNTLLHFL